MFVSGKYMKGYITLSHLRVSNFLLFNILFRSSVITIFTFQKQQGKLYIYCNMPNARSFFINKLPEYGRSRNL